MDIGTSKPSRAMRAEYPHALIDILDPEESFTASEFVERADAEIRKAFTQERTPLLVGGTMLYFKAFREGLTPLPPRNEKFRTNLRRERDQSSSANLHEQLRAIDPASSARIHPNNYARIERALEVHAITGQTLTHWIESQPSQPVKIRHDCDYIEFGLTNIARPTLHARIATRLNEMLENGFVEEVLELQQRPNLTAKCMSMKAVGYAQLWEYLKTQPREPSGSAVKDKILAATRQLARRQLTWIRSWRTLGGFNEISVEAATESIEEAFDNPINRVI